MRVTTGLKGLVEEALRRLAAGRGAHAQEASNDGSALALRDAAIIRIMSEHARSDRPGLPPL